VNDEKYMDMVMAYFKTFWHFPGEPGKTTNITRFTVCPYLAETVPLQGLHPSVLAGL
jgi:hypothetical protein